MLSLKNVLLIACGIFTALSTFAQHGAGNNGLVVEDKGELYLLDFFESGIQETARLGEYYNPIFGNADQMQFIKVATAYFYQLPFSDLEKEELIKKISNIRNRHEFLATALLFKWRIIDKPVLKVTPPDTIIDLSEYNVYAAAVRRDDTITINRKIWDRLSLKNKIGLILHEIIYATVQPVDKNDGTQTQSSWDARTIVAGIFEPCNESGACLGGGDLKVYMKRNGRRVLTIKGEGEVMFFNGAQSSDSFSTIRMNPHVMLFQKRPINSYNGKIITLSMDSGSVEQTANYLPYLCDPDFDYGNSMFLLLAYDEYTIELKDYMSQNGPNKYAAISSQEVTALANSFYPVSRTSNGSVRGFKDLNFKNRNDCLKGIPKIFADFKEIILEKYVPY